MTPPISSTKCGTPPTYTGSSHFDLNHKDRQKPKITTIMINDNKNCSLINSKFMQETFSALLMGQLVNVPAQNSTCKWPQKTRLMCANDTAGLFFLPTGITTNCLQYVEIMGDKLITYITIYQC